jgi:hypothetical protein
MVMRVDAAEITLSAANVFSMTGWEVSKGLLPQWLFLVFSTHSLCEI